MYAVRSGTLLRLVWTAPSELCTICMQQESVSRSRHYPPYVCWNFSRCDSDWLNAVSMSAGEVKGQRCPQYLLPYCH